MATPPSPLGQSSSSSHHRRRPSVNITRTSPRAIPSASPRSIPVSVPSPNAVPLPVPQRHGSISVHGSSFHSGSFHGGSFGSVSDLTSPRMRGGHRSSGSFSGSVSLGNSFVLGPAMTDDSDSWLDTAAGDITKDAVPVIPGNTGLEEATETLIKGDSQCLIVQTGGGYGLFDFADLNTVLLLVLMAASKETLSSLDDRTREVVTCLTRGIRLGVGTVCDISQKNPCSIFSPDTPLRRLLPLFASGVHRVVVSSDPPRLLEASALLAHLTRLPPPMFRLCLSEVDVPLHRFVSLPINASVLDAMQVMSLNGLGAIGVVTGDSERDGELSSLVGVVTVADCSKVVVPSEGKQALGMGLGDMCKKVLSGHHGGRERGEERVPVHTITPNTSILHAANLILATSSSRVFLRTLPAASPPLSPVSSFEQLPTSPGVSASSNFAGLPNPPSTQLSSQYVISILDILSCLAHAYQPKLSPIEAVTGGESWDMLPDSVSKRRRRASSSAAFSGFETWRWAAEPVQL